MIIYSMVLHAKRGVLNIFQPNSGADYKDKLDAPKREDWPNISEIG